METHQSKIEQTGQQVSISQIARRVMTRRITLIIIGWFVSSYAYAVSLCTRNYRAGVYADTLVQKGGKR